MFNTSLDISNRAVLPPEWSIDDHRSFQLNPLISETFEKAGFVEKFGTGISKIVSACKENGNKIPSFEVTSGGKEMTVEFSASKLYIAIEEYRDNLERKGSFIDYRNVVELMNSGKLHDPDYDPNLATDSMPKNVTLPKSKIHLVIAEKKEYTTADNLIMGVVHISCNAGSDSGGRRRSE